MIKTFFLLSIIVSGHLVFSFMSIKNGLKAINYDVAVSKTAIIKSQKKNSLRLNIKLYEQLGRVTIYYKENCPYCQKTKALLGGKYNLELSLVDIEGQNRLELF
jgi:hypothetical protein